MHANGDFTYKRNKIYHEGAKPQFDTDIEDKPDTLAGYGIRNFKVEQGQGDANGYKTDGNYYLASGQNLPENGAWHIEVVSGGATNAVRQIARKANDNKIKTRFLMAQIGQNGKRQAATACLLVRWCHFLVR